MSALSFFNPNSNAFLLYDNLIDSMSGDYIVQFGAKTVSLPYQQGKLLEHCVSVIPYLAYGYYCSDNLGKGVIIGIASTIFDYSAKRYAKENLSPYGSDRLPDSRRILSKLCVSKFLWGPRCLPMVLGYQYGMFKSFFRPTISRPIESAMKLALVTRIAGSVLGYNGHSAASYGFLAGSLIGAAKEWRIFVHRSFLRDC